MKNFAGNLPKNFDIDQKNRILIVEAVLLLALLLGGLVFGFHACVSTKASPTQKSSFSTQNFIEAESMMISNKSGDFSCSLQDTRTFVIGKWTNDSHMFVAAKRNGDWSVGQNVRAKGRSVNLAGNWGTTAIILRW